MIGHYTRRQCIEASEDCLAASEFAPSGGREIADLRLYCGADPAPLSLVDDHRCVVVLHRQLHSVHSEVALNALLALAHRANEVGVRAPFPLFSE